MDRQICQDGKRLNPWSSQSTCLCHMDFSVKAELAWATTLPPPALLWELLWRVESTEKWSSLQGSGASAGSQSSSWAWPNEVTGAGKSVKTKPLCLEVATHDWAEPALDNEMCGSSKPCWSLTLCFLSRAASPLLLCSSKSLQCVCLFVSLAHNSIFQYYLKYYLKYYL